MKLLGVLGALCLALAPAAAQHGPSNNRPPRTYSTEAVSAADAERWRADLRQLVGEIARLHPAPYARTPRDTFAARVQQVHQRIPSLAAHEIIVEFERLIALVGDGHTNLNLASGAGVDFHQLPIRFGLYDDGLWIEAADRAYADAVGGRVVSFGEVPVETALARLRPLISRDNDQWIQAATPHLINLVELLHALRLTDRLDRVLITVERNGTRRVVEARPLADPRNRAMFYPFMPRYTADWVDARDAAKAPAPLYQRRFDEVYWWEYLPDDGLVYIKWDQISNRAIGATALQTFREAMNFARQNPGTINKVLLDLRNNTGGEGGLLDPVLREIVRTREVDEPGRFFVAIGPRTFSAALLFTVQLQRYSSAIFVGEPTGGKVNVPAGHVFVTLANSGLGVSISPLVYQSSFPSDTRPYVAPRLAVRPTFADYAANRDPVIAAVLAYRGEEVAEQVERFILRGDTSAAEQVLRTHAADPINRYAGAAPAINALGYRFLRADQTEEALRVFRLNVRVFPEYTNGWDSLGEAYEQAGKIAEAIAAFEVVVRREPENGRAREFLQRLRTRRTP